MDRNVFGRLCRLLCDGVGLKDQKFVIVEEVAMFLCVLSHHKKTRVAGFDFMCYTQYAPWGAYASQSIFGET